MQCRNCNAKLEEGALFCTQCGTKIEEPLTSQEPPRNILDKEKSPVEEPIREVNPERVQSDIGEERVVEIPDVKSKVSLKKEVDGNTSFLSKEEVFEARELSEIQEIEVEEVPMSQELAVQKEYIFCGHCGARMEAGEIFCENCEKPLSEELLVSSQTSKKPLPFKKIVALLVLIVLAFVGVKGTKALFSGFGKGSEQREIYYLKGSEMYCLNLNNRKSEPSLYAENIYLEDGVEELYGWKYRYQLKSRDGKIDFIVEDYNSTVGTITLSYKIGNTKKQEIDNDVQSYTVTDDNKVLYLKNDNLYLSDLKNRDKIASGVTDYLLDKDQKIVLWTESKFDPGLSDVIYSLYYRDIQLKKDKVELGKDINIILTCSEDFNKILFKRDNAVYIIRNLKDEEKLVDDVMGVYSMNIDKESFYYTQSDTLEVNAMDLITDDMKTADMQLKEPDRKDYEKTETSQDFFSYTTVDDKYYEDRKLYEEKQHRDQLRASFEQKTLNLEASKLYYYTGKESQLLKEDVFMVGAEQFNEETSEYYVIYYAFDPESENKVKLSEIPYEDYLESELWVLREAVKKPFLNMQGKDVELKMGKNTGYIYPYGMSGTELYANVSEESEGESKDNLVSISLSDKDAGTVTEKDEDVSVIHSIEGKNVYYFKNRPNSFESVVFSGGFYCNGELLAEDVNEVRFLKDKKGILFLSSDGELFLLRGEDRKKIADDVEYFSFFDDKSIFMLTDYNYDRMEGDLEYFDGKELKSLDTDVKMIVDCVE